MAQYKGFIFDGINSADYDVVITGASTYSAPERAVELYDIPGRNGALAIDQGRFANIEITYHCAMADRNQATFAQRLSALRNQLCSRYSYVRLTDDYNADEYRLALYKSGLDADLVIDRGGEFDVVFDCKPQRFLTSGESTYQIGEWGQTITQTGDIVTYQGDDITVVKSLTTDMEPMQDLHGYDHPWPAGGGKNLFSKDPLIRWFTKSVPSGGKIYAQWFDGGGDFQLYAQDANNTEYSLGLITRNKKAFTAPADIVSFGVSASAIQTLGSGNLMISLSDFSGWEPYENICPIYGRTGQNVFVTGKNLFDWSAIPDSNPSIGWTKNTDYCEIDATFTTSKQLNFVGNRRLIKAGTYTLSQYLTVDNSNIRVALYIYDSGGSFIRQINVFGNSSATFTLDKDYLYAWAISFIAAGTYNTELRYQLERSSTATAYEPYTGSTYTRSFVDGQGNELTVYGGEDEIVGGVLTVTHAIAEFAGSESWSKYGSGSASAYAMKTPYTTPRAKAGVRPISNYADGLIAADTYGNYDCFISTSDATVWVAGKRDITTVADWKTWLASSPLQVVYELDTPITYQLTPQEVTTLIGTNHVWSDAGEVTVEYGTDPYTMVNDTPFASKPLIRVTGYGEVGFGDITITITGTAGVVTYIDCDLMECYRMSGGAITPANQYVTFTGTDFPTIPTGKTRVTSASTISKVEVVPRWWII